MKTPVLLTDFLEESACRWGSRTAIEDAHSSVTYAELRAKAQQVARFLSAQPEVTEQPIGVYFPKGIACVTAMLGVLYHGGMYAPLDVRAPVSYVEKALDILECEWILTDQAGEEALRRAGVKQKLFNVEQLPSELSDHLSCAARVPLDCDAAFLLFTSGSTGVPKGVAISHRRVRDYIAWAQSYFSCDEQTVIGNQAPFLFTVSVMDLYLCLSVGARLCLIPEHTLATPALLLEYLRKQCYRQRQ